MLNLREQLLSITRKLSESGLNRGTSGNASVREGYGFLVTPSGMEVDVMTPKDMVRMVFDGKVHGDLPPGRGVVDFMPYLKALDALGVNQDDRVISIELEYSPMPSRIAEWVREAYQSTAKLMAQAGLRS